MATVPIYQRRVALRGMDAPRVAVDAADQSGLIQGLNDVGRSAFQISQQRKQEADATALLEADNKTTEWQNNAFFNQEYGVYSRKGRNALNVTADTLSAFDKQVEEITGSLADDRQRAIYKQKMIKRRIAMSEDLNRYEAQQHTRYMDDVDSANVQLSIDSAALNYNDPSKVGEFRAKVNDVMDGRAARLGWSPEELQVQKLSASSKLLTGVIGRMVSESPNRAKQYLNSARDGMTADDQSRIESAIQREIKSREIEARQMRAIAQAELSSKMQDEQSAYLAGLDYDAPVSRSQLVNAYGAEEGTQRFDRMQKLRGLSVDIRELATASPEERDQILSRYNPTNGGVASEGYRENAQVYGVLANAATTLLKQQQADPAEFVQRHSPTVRNAAAALADGGSAEQYAAAVLAEQRRLGIEEPRLLPNRLASSIAKRFNDTEDGGAGSAKMIGELQQQWGKSWPIVFKQLQTELPPAAMIIGSGVDEATGSMLATIAPLKTEELKRGLDSSAAKDVRESLNDELGDFSATLNGQVGGERTRAVVYEQAERLALAYMGQGLSAKEAAAKVKKSFVDDKYTIAGTYRVPSNYDASLVERGASLAIGQLPVDELEFTLPKGLDADFAKDRVKGAVERDGYWVTTPDESGLALYFQGAALLDKNGNPIVRRFTDLIETASKSPTLWERFNKGRESMRSAPVQAR